MATSLGLNPEDLFTSYSSSYYSSPPFMSDYAASFTPAAGDSTAFSSELDDLHHFDYSPAPIVTAAGAGAGGGDRNEKMMWCEGGGDERRLRSNGRIGFRTRSEVEILDDGFKWRKYGKKAVKNSPNPRNYYRCSSEGCGVKKRVERDRDDPRYVITTYDGVHNHASPGAAAIIVPYGSGGGNSGFYSPPHSGSPSATSYSGSLVF